MPMARPAAVRVIQVGVGLFILWSILFTPPAIFRRSGGVAGAISSFLTMFFGGTGPFVAAFVKSLRLPRQSHVATHATLMTIQHMLKILAFGLLGFAFAPWIGLVALLILFGFAGTLVGGLVLARIDEARFKLALNAILALLAARLIYSGAQAIWADRLAGGG